MAQPHSSGNHNQDSSVRYYPLGDRRFRVPRARGNRCLEVALTRDMGCPLGAAKTIIGIGDRMRRREVIALIGGTAVVWPGISVAQVTATRSLVAILTARPPEAMRRYVNAFAQGIQEFGLVEGRDYEIVLRSTDGDTT